MDKSKRSYIQQYSLGKTEDALNPDLLSDVIHRVGHEIGNPLTSIISLATIIERFQNQKDQDSSATKFASSIISEAWKVGGIMDNLVLMLSQREISKEKIDPLQIINKASTRLRNRSAFCLDEVIIRLVKDDNSPCTSDPELLLAAVCELLLNALKSQDKEFPNGCIGPTVAVQNSSKFLSIEVINKLDQNCPPLEHLAKHLGRREEYSSGVGIGLPTVAKIAARLGGELLLSEWKDTNKEKYFSAELCLQKPAKKDHAVEPKAQEKTMDSDIDQESHKLYFLIVEDQDAVASAIEKILTITFNPTPIKCICANGAKAMQLLEQGDRPDAILCDLQLADMRGGSIYAWISENRPELRPRFALMTGGNPPENLKDVSCLHKPFEPEELYNLVIKLVGENS